MNYKISLIITLLFAVVCIGCSDHVGLSGKVVFSDDGSPVPRGTVMFATPTFQAKGDINPDGTFTMGSYSATDGLPPGTYTVAIIGANTSTGDDGTYYLLDPKWTSPSTSEYTVEVQKTTRNLVIEVDRNPR